MRSNIICRSAYAISTQNLTKIMDGLTEEFSSVAEKWQKYKNQRVDDGADFLTKNDEENFPEQIILSEDVDKLFHGLKVLTESREKLRELVSSRLPHRYYGNKFLPHGVYLEKKILKMSKTDFVDFHFETDTD